MNKKDLLKFLNSHEQVSLKNYNFAELDIKDIKEKSYIKYMYKYNYSLQDGGILIRNKYPILVLRDYKTKQEISINADKCFIFWKAKKVMSQREFYEGLLKNLENMSIKKNV